MPINKFTTLGDLARQAKIISGETATFDGKIQVGIPFSGYPTGVDTGTTVSLGIVSSEDAVFSGNTGTTIFDVSNTGSTNYSPIFSGYSGSVWTNVLFSGNTSGLTLPITPLSADTQIVGPIWTLTQTGMTGDYVIGTQYTGYSVTYSFFNVSQFGTGFTYSGFTTASQENFSAGTLDYKGPLDYISTKEDASVEGRLTTNKITITNGASASTIGYVLTQTGENGEAEWVINASADTNTYVTGGTLTGTDLTLDWNTGGSANTIDLSGLEFTGNTSGDCINDIFVKNIHSCSPLNINPLDEGNVYFGSSSGVTIDVINSRLGIGNNTPSEKLHISGGDMLVENTNGKFITDIQNTNGPLVLLSGGTNGITRYGVIVPTFDALTMGIRGGSDVTFTDYGKNGDAFVRSSNPNNGLNIISEGGTGTDDYIRFYAGQNASPGNTPDLYIQGSGTTRGNVGIGTETPTEKLHIDGSVRIVDGTEQNNYVFTSNPNGVGSWQNIDGIFTGNTSATCITDLYVRRLYGCSPITVHDTITYNGSIIDSATTNSFIFGSNHVLTATSLTHGVHADANSILGGFNNRITPFQNGLYNTIIGGNNNTLGIGRLQSSSIISSEDSKIGSSNGPNVILGGSNNTINGSNGNVILGGTNNNIDSNDSSAILGGDNNSILSPVRRSVVLGGSGITGTTDDTVYVPTLNINTIGSGTPVNNLGYDSSGNVVTGGTVNLSRRTTTQNAFADPDVNNVEVVFYSASSAGGIIYLNSAMNVAGKEVI
jgi:hypothetical protein